ncbi:pyridine nucleotide-disulfide oxidoreductase domain-containing protein 1 [Toxorhynchites rutilus septentrionalis]|uniref:pyridine nucleotide-disulfide oxidoreductase domain-containing protein 1 n=1 Tax=Toxorhynchites rutilus septentrionalis TaxID=329112 RepID=UPI00247A72B8|nr:pyridine nucleotide-disulfide oxidoreductase domain-containing protein 1 [Toxorhynchites rutilus septentrionalis]
MELNCTYLIVGGGIAGVSCAEALAFLADPSDSIILITESAMVKATVNPVPLGKVLTQFEVQEKRADTLGHSIQALEDQLQRIESDAKYVKTSNGNRINYRYLCVCTGARPKLIEQAGGNPNVIGIRDTESVQEFRERIKCATRLVVVGNGGIASEIVYEISGVEIHWVVKDDYISSTFVDSAAARFFQERLTCKGEEKSIVKRMRYSEQKAELSVAKHGAALGPDWHRTVNIVGKLENVPSSVKIHYSAEIEEIMPQSKGFPLKLRLSNGDEVECDLIVSATGVTPAANFTSDHEFKLGPDGGLFVNWEMETSLKNVFAAGDICYAGWEHARHWFQMRLWTQARQMGAMAARAMAARRAGETIYQDFCFEMFNHVTQLFGYQVVLLGRYNGQGLNDKYEVLLRMTPGLEYIKFVLVDGRLQGAMLIGETGLEETSENLILNQLDLTPYGDDLLDPNIDIEDYFD